MLFSVVVFFVQNGVIKICWCHKNFINLPEIF